MTSPRLILEKNDITKQEVDAIVNATNFELKHDEGVAKAIVEAAGQKLIDESAIKRGVPTGQVATTSGGNLKAKYVIHIAGPVWNGGNKNEKQVLEDCIRNSLLEAERLSVRSIAFPAISTGIFGFPIKETAKVMLKTVSNYKTSESGLKLIKFILLSDEEFNVFKEELILLNKNK